MPFSAALAPLPHTACHLQEKPLHSSSQRKRTSLGETPKLLNQYSCLLLSTYPSFSPSRCSNLCLHPTPRNLTLTTTPANTHLSPPECLPFRMDAEANATQKTKSHDPLIELQPVLVPAISLLFHSFLPRLLEGTAPMTPALSTVCSSFYCSTTNILSEVNGVVCALGSALCPVGLRP